jgi:flagellar biosynthesis protein FliQ
MMSMDWMLHHVQRGIMLSLLISMPPILAAAAIGLLVGIIQAVTQVQEQTISAVPKLVLVFLMLILGGGLMLELMGGYVKESMTLAFLSLPKSGDQRVLPPRSLGVRPANALLQKSVP